MSRFDLPLSGRVYAEEGLRVNADYTLILDMMSDRGAWPVVITWRAVGDDGHIYEGVETVTSDALAVTQRNIFNLPAGVLVQLTVGVDGDVGDIGEVRARVRLGARGGSNTAGLVLVDGYVGGGAEVSWPYSPNGTADAQLGKYDETYLATGVVGSDIAILQPPGIFLDVRAFSCTLTTDANVANRLVNFSVQTIGTTVQRNITANTIVQAASTTVTYHGVTDLGSAAIATGTTVVMPLGHVTLAGGGIGGTNSDLLQVGDQFIDLYIAGYRRFAFV